MLNLYYLCISSWFHFRFRWPVSVSTFVWHPNGFSSEAFQNHAFNKRNVSGMKLATFHVFLSFHAFRGHSKTTWTNFCPILTIYLPIMDFCGHLVHYLPFVYVYIEKTNPPPPWIHMWIWQYMPSFTTSTE